MTSTIDAKPEPIQIEARYRVLTGHDLQLVEVTDLIAHRGELRRVTKRVTKIDRPRGRKPSRGEEETPRRKTVTLDNGFVFEPAADEIKGFDNPRSVTIYRPRAAFRAFGRIQGAK